MRWAMAVGGGGCSVAQSRGAGDMTCGHDPCVSDPGNATEQQRGHCKACLALGHFVSRENLRGSPTSRTDESTWLSKP